MIEVTLASIVILDLKDKLIATVELLLGATSSCRGHKRLSRKNAHIFFVSITSIKGKPLFGGKGHFFGCRRPVLTSIKGTPENVTGRKEGL